MWSNIVYQINIATAKGKHGLLNGTDVVCHFTVITYSIPQAIFVMFYAEERARKDEKQICRPMNRVARQQRKTRQFFFVALT